MVIAIFLLNRLKVLVEYFKMALDCFFAVWFVVGNVWIFGGHSSANEAPNLYRYFGQSDYFDVNHSFCGCFQRGRGEIIPIFLHAGYV